MAGKHFTTYKFEKNSKYNSSKQFMEIGCQRVSRRKKVWGPILYIVDQAVVLQQILLLGADGVGGSLVNIRSCQFSSDLGPQNTVIIHQILPILLASLHQLFNLPKKPIHDTSFFCFVFFCDKKKIFAGNTQCPFLAFARV